MMLKPHAGTVIVEGRLCSGKLAEGTGINVSNCSAVQRHEISEISGIDGDATPGVAMHFGRVP